MQVALNCTDDAKREFCTGDCPSDIRDFFNDCSDTVPAEVVEEVETSLEGKCSRVIATGHYSIAANYYFN